MTSLRALIVDDEPLAHDVLLELANDIPSLEIVGQCYLATEAMEFLRNNPVDVMFLDIQMPRLKGTDFLKVLDTRPIVIITSAYPDYALEGFELEVCDYLLKPIQFERFLKAVNKARNVWEQQAPAAEASVDEQPGATRAERIFVKVDKRHIQVALPDIHYLEAFGNYVKLWQQDGHILTARTLSSFIEQLPESQFVRIHKSFIINRDQIDYLEGNMVVLKNGKSLLIGKLYRSTFRQSLG